MNRIAFDVNALWFYSVLAHIGGSIVFTIMGFFPLGNVICLAGLWLACYHVTEKNSGNTAKIVVGLILTMGIMFMLPAAYKSSFLMNGLILLIVYYICKQRRITVFEYCNMRWFTIRQGLMIVIMTLALLIIASYVNAISMLFVQNTVSTSLAEAENHLLSSIFVYGILPAFAEEMLFRGCIYGEIKNKKIALVISALVFALLHMNFNQMSYAFVMGILLAAMFMVTNNLSVSIAVHFLFNGWNVIMSAFWNYPLIAAITHWSIGDYTFFSPSFTNGAGEFDVSIFLIGTLFTGIISLLVIMGLYLVKKGNSVDEEKLALQEWHPDRGFWVGSLACLVIAILYEL